MKVIEDWKSVPTEGKGGILCVGNFDGVHVGHAAMLGRGREEASKRGVGFCVMTFEPHPAVLLKPGVPREALSTVEQRVELLAKYSPDVVIMIRTTKEFLSMTAEAFLQTVVRGSIDARVMVEGPTFNFGRGAKGDVRMLQEKGSDYGVETIVVSTQQAVLSDMTAVNVSSSLIRWLVAQGRVRDAGKLLGRQYALRGRVIRGAQRGRELGFPTANLEISQLAPAPGVYGGEAMVDGTRYRAAISVGDNPTFGAGGQSTVEAFLLDFDGDLYGKTIDVTFDTWVRDMVAFAGVEPLIEQMKRDVAIVRITKN